MQSFLDVRDGFPGGCRGWGGRRTDLLLATFFLGVGPIVHNRLTRRGWLVVAGGSSSDPALLGVIITLLDFRALVIVRGAGGRSSCRTYGSMY